MYTHSLINLCLTPLRCALGALVKVALLIGSLFFLLGCWQINSLDSEWKKSMVQLQITPVMPLRQNLQVGEVYRYSEKPEHFDEGAGGEPNVAFQLNMKSAHIEAGARIWPTFSFSGGSEVAVSAASQAAGILSANLSTRDLLTISVSKGFSKRISAARIIAEFCDISTNQQGQPKLTVKSKYQASLRAMGVLAKASIKPGRVEQVLYLRIPTEVYFARTLHVSASKSTEDSAGIKIAASNKFPPAAGNITVAINSDKLVSLIETFDQPMAIGYRAILLKVWIDSMRVEELAPDHTF